MSRARILVTGAAGFIGSHVARELLDAKWLVRGLDVLHPSAHGGRPSGLPVDVEWVWGDVRDAELLDSCLDGIDAVCHQAAMVGLGQDFGDVERYVAHNAAGTAALLHALHRRRFRGRLVLASSMVVYGEGGWACERHGSVAAPPRRPADLAAGRYDPLCPTCSAALSPTAVTEEAPTDPRNVYAATKLHQEHLCAAYARESGVDLTILRYHNVYGPRMPRDTPYAGVASLFASALAARREPRVFEDGAQLRDFVHVRDVAIANRLALEVDGRPGTYNIASGRPRTILALAQALADATAGSPSPVITGEWRLGDVRHVFASPRRAAAELGFTASTSWADGISEFARAPQRAPVATAAGP